MGKYSQTSLALKDPLLQVLLSLRVSLALSLSLSLSLSLLVWLSPSVFLTLGLTLSFRLGLPLYLFMKKVWRQLSTGSLGGPSQFTLEAMPVRVIILKLCPEARNTVGGSLHSQAPECGTAPSCPGRFQLFPGS